MFLKINIKITKQTKKKGPLTSVLFEIKLILEVKKSYSFMLHFKQTQTTNHKTASELRVLMKTIRYG